MDCHPYIVIDFMRKYITIFKMNFITFLLQYTNNFSNLLKYIITLLNSYKYTCKFARENKIMLQSIK